MNPSTSLEPLPWNTDPPTRSVIVPKSESRDRFGARLLALEKSALDGLHHEYFAGARANLIG